MKIKNELFLIIEIIFYQFSLFVYLISIILLNDHFNSTVSTQVVPVP